MAKSLRNPNRCPTHPGAILREDVLPALGLTQKEFADRLGVSRLTVSEVLLEKRSVTPDMAIRLGRLLGNGPEIWLRMQQAVDVWTLEQRAVTSASSAWRLHNDFKRPRCGPPGKRTSQEPVTVSRQFAVPPPAPATPTRQFVKCSVRLGYRPAAQIVEASRIEIGRRDEVSDCN